VNDLLRRARSRGAHWLYAAADRVDLRDSTRAMSAAGDAGGGVPPLRHHLPVPEANIRYVEVGQLERDERRVPMWPLPGPVDGRSQLGAAFQCEQAHLRENVRLEDGHWYHEVPCTDGRRVRGAWDLIGGEEHYLGGFDPAGQRILEFGPASGYLTMYLEQHGAEVVAFEAGLDSSIDLITDDTRDLGSMRCNAMRFIGEVNNSWWWVKHHHDLKARIAYGSIYALPELGRFDVSFFGAILLHLRDPYLALKQAADRTCHHIVIADVVPSGPGVWTDPSSRFNPASGDPTSWWLHAPAALARMVETLGFRSIELTRHEQYVRPGHALDMPKEPVEFFTIVASRTEAPSEH
jgi:O-methyltransferase